MESLVDIARGTTDRLGMLPDASPVLALVSGGADSVCLLRLLAAGDLGPTGPLSVLHVNHQLRGAEADADADFVRGLCAQLGVEVLVVDFDVAQYAEAEALNLEDAGRRVRYRFAEEALDAACAAARVRPELGRIATAHTRDDRVETFLMRAITGAGASGLSSIPYVRGRIVRPLLDCDRADVREYLGELGQAWREDASNSDTSRLRALVRAQMVPIAERVNPAFRETLARSIDLLAADDALLSRLADDFSRDFAETTAEGRVEFDRAFMATLDPAMARRTVRKALIRAFPEASRLDSFHVDALVTGFSADAFARDLPYGLRAETEYGKLFVSRAGTEPPALAPCLLPLPGNALLGHAGSIAAEEVEPADIAGDTDSITIDAGQARSLVVDAVRPGDRMRPLGMSGSRKLSDLLTDDKVPRRLRKTVPVIRDGERIVWLAGVRMSEEYRVGPDTTRAIRLTWDRESGD
jgi:tRNA(Ile)-lysidine synthase